MDKVMTKTVDEWAAEQCGVKIEPGYWIHNYVQRRGSFHIVDPRCREIVRENFRIRTTRADSISSEWMWYSLTRNTLLPRSCWGYGKTIAESEIACITAIYEVSQ